MKFLNMLIRSQGMKHLTCYIRYWNGFTVRKGGQMSEVKVKHQGHKGQKVGQNLMVKVTYTKLMRWTRRSFDTQAFYKLKSVDFLVECNTPLQKAMIF